MPEKSPEKADGSDEHQEVAEEGTGEVIDSPIQIDGNADVDAIFELKVVAHEECSNDDVIEAIETNFYGAFDDKNVADESDTLRTILIKKLDDEQNLLKLQ